jgi:hypothetical protein
VFHDYHHHQHHIISYHIYAGYLHLYTWNVQFLEWLYCSYSVVTIHGFYNSSFWIILLLLFKAQHIFPLQPQKWTTIMISNYNHHCTTTKTCQRTAQMDSQCTSSMYSRTWPQLHHQWLYDQLSNLHTSRELWLNSQTGHIVGQPAEESGEGRCFKKFEYINAHTN